MSRTYETASSVVLASAWPKWIAVNGCRLKLMAAANTVAVLQSVIEAQAYGLRHRRALPLIPNPLNRKLALTQRQRKLLATHTMIHEIRQCQDQLRASFL